MTADGLPTNVYQFTREPHSTYVTQCFSHDSCKSHYYKAMNNLVKSNNI